MELHMCNTYWQFIYRLLSWNYWRWCYFWHSIHFVIIFLRDELIYWKKNKLNVDKNMKLFLKDKKVHNIGDGFNNNAKFVMIGDHLESFSDFIRIILVIRLGSHERSHAIYCSKFSFTTVIFLACDCKLLEIYCSRWLKNNENFHRRSHFFRKLL